MKEIDDTDPPKTESEQQIALLREQIIEITLSLEKRIAALEAHVADLHHRRRVSRQQATDQDPEWF